MSRIQNRLMLLCNDNDPQVLCDTHPDSAIQVLLLMTCTTTQTYLLKSKMKGLRERPTFSVYGRTTSQRNHKLNETFIKCSDNVYERIQQKPRSSCVPEQPLQMAFVTHSYIACFRNSNLNNQSC